MGATEVGEIVAGLKALLDELLTVELSGVDGVGLVELVDELQRHRRRLDAVDVRLVSELGARGVAGEFGRASVADLLAVRLRVTPGEARQRVALATDLGPRSTLAGETLLPIHSQVSAAMSSGILGAEHAQVITDCLGRVPASLPDEATDIAEEFLVAAAGHEDPRALRRTAALLLARLDPDGLEPSEEEQERRRGFSLTGRGDGSSRPSGSWTAETAAVWQAILDSLAAPQPDPDGTPDPRSASQRRHDAMREAGLRLLRSGTLPDVGGAPVTVLVRVEERDLDNAAGVAVTGSGELLSARTVRRLAGDGAIIGVRFDHDGAVLACGRTRRLATVTQRRALAARDGGCTFPACARPAAWSEVHHVQPWSHGGSTDLDNLTSAKNILLAGRTSGFVP